MLRLKDKIPQDVIDMVQKNEEERLISSLKGHNVAPNTPRHVLVNIARSLEKKGKVNGRKA